MKSRRDDNSLDRELNSTANKAPSEKARRCLFGPGDPAQNRLDADLIWKRLRTSSNGADHIRRTSTTPDDDNTRSSDSARIVEDDANSREKTQCRQVVSSRIVSRSGSLSQRRTQSLSDTICSTDQADIRQKPIQTVSNVDEFMQQSSDDHRFIPISPDPDDDDEIFEDPLADSCSSLRLHDYEINNNQLLVCPSHRRTLDFIESSSTSMDIDVDFTTTNDVGNSRNQNSAFETLTRPALFRGHYEFQSNEEACTFECDTTFGLPPGGTSSTACNADLEIFDLVHEFPSFLDDDLQKDSRNNSPRTSIPSETIGFSEIRTFSDHATTLHHNSPNSPLPALTHLGNETLAERLNLSSTKNKFTSTRKPLQRPRKDILHCRTKSSSSSRLSSLVSSRRRHTLSSFKYSRPKSDDTDGASVNLLKKSNALRFHRRSPPSDRTA